MLFDPQKLIRAQVFVAPLALGGIAAFALIYVLLGGTEPLIRLLTALCLPPLLIAGVMMVYLLFLRRRPAQGQESESPPL